MPKPPPGPPTDDGLPGPLSREAAIAPREDIDLNEVFRWASDKARAEVLRDGFNAAAEAAQNFAGALQAHAAADRDGARKAVGAAQEALAIAERAAVTFATDTCGLREGSVLKDRGPDDLVTRIEAWLNHVRTRGTDKERRLAAALALYSGPVIWSAVLDRIRAWERGRDPKPDNDLIKNFAEIVNRSLAGGARNTVSGSVKVAKSTIKALRLLADDVTSTAPSIIPPWLDIEFQGHRMAGLSLPADRRSWISHRCRQAADELARVIDDVAREFDHTAPIGRQRRPALAAFNEYLVDVVGMSTEQACRKLKKLGIAVPRNDAIRQQRSRQKRKQRT